LYDRSVYFVFIWYIFSSFEKSGNPGFTTVTAHRRNLHEGVGREREREGEEVRERGKVT
jgi:hypothetical protein